VSSLMRSKTVGASCEHVPHDENCKTTAALPDANHNRCIDDPLPTGMAT
jgi:hypothetical protein